MPEKRQRKPRSRTLDEGMLNLVPNGKPVVRKRAESLKGVQFTKPSDNVPGKRPLQPLPNSSLTENELRQKKINATMMATIASQHGKRIYDFVHILLLANSFTKCHLQVFLFIRTLVIRRFMPTYEQ